MRDAAWLGGQIGMSSASRDLHPTLTDCERIQLLLWRDDEGSYCGGLFGLGSKTSDRLDGKMFTGPFVDGRYQPTAQPRYSRCTQRLFLMNVLRLCATGCLTTWTRSRGDVALLSLSMHSTRWESRSRTNWCWSG